jgi:SAM-dependent methyltransferase
MPERSDLDDLIRDYAKRLAREIQAMLPRQPTEAEFRQRVDRLLEEFCEKAGLNPLSRLEYTLASGRADAIFNRLIVEYKQPGKLSDRLSHRATREAVEQVKRYLTDLARQSRLEKARLAGIVTDGLYIIFVRYLGGSAREEGPVKVGPESLEKMLHWLAGLASGKPLTAENLNEDFSIEQLRTQNILRAMMEGLSRSLRETPHGMVARLFEQWRLFFSESIDYAEAFGGRKLEPLKKWTRRAGLTIHTPEEAERFFFVLHTYFALLVKLLAWLALSRHMAVRLGAPAFGELQTADSETLRRRLGEMESGGIFRAYGIANLLEGDFFAWYLYAWNDRIESALRELLDRLDKYDPATLALIPEETRDLFKQLYHYLLPREIRHNLGEYYTPDWLAQRLLNQVDPEFFTADPERNGSALRRKLLTQRWLDPACGSGTFLVLLIRRMRQLGEALMVPERDLLQAILRNVVGFDLNPLAVLTARVNYLLAIADLLEHRTIEITIPIYLADSIRMPSLGKELRTAGAYEFPTAVGNFLVPAAVCDSRERFDRFCRVLEESVQAGLSVESLIDRVRSFAPKAEESRLRELYEQFLELHRRGLDGLWARLLQNNFAPLVAGPFDCIVGNPPWINWEHLPDQYRSELQTLWREMQAGGPVYLGKKWDISLLMAQVVMTHLLKPGGRLGFVITQSAFKTNLGGRDFRKFRLPDQNQTPVRVLHVDDMVSLQPFEGASNRTAVMVLEKGKATRYPVPYTLWRKVRGKRFTYNSTLDEVMRATCRFNFYAEPVDPSDPTSPWLTARPKALKAIRKALGNSDYEAHEGVNTGGANAVYWVDIVYKRPDGLVVVRNITEGAKVKVEEVTEPIEGDLLYPLLRGRDVQRWKAEPSARIIMTYLETRSGPRVIEPSEMERRYPNTLRYLRRFESVLKRRADYRHYFEPSGKPFYAMMPRPGSFAPWKVVWREVSYTLDAAVAGPFDGKPTVPDHTLILIDCASKDEAHYICAALNSAPARLGVQAYIVLHPDPHILEHIRIPRFNPKDPVHRRLAELSERAHEAAKREDVRRLRQIEEAVDEAAARLWGLTDAELREIRRSLVELQRAEEIEEEEE